jgi:hypothetical protein
MSTKEELLTDLEKVLSITEQFKDNMDSKDRKVWQDISASTADERDNIPVPYVLVDLRPLTKTIRYPVELATGLPVNSVWDNDLVQFARLLSEIRAACDMQGFDAVLKSMDITEDMADELFDRAERMWEKAKQIQCAAVTEVKP